MLQILSDVLRQLCTRFNDAPYNNDPIKRMRRKNLVTCHSHPLYNREGTENSGSNETLDFNPLLRQQRQQGINYSTVMSNTQHKLQGIYLNDVLFTILLKNRLINIFILKLLRYIYDYSGTGITHVV